MSDIKLVRFFAAAVAFVSLGLTACRSVPPEHPALADARVALNTANADPNVARTAAVELQQAREALSRAEAAWVRDQNSDEARNLGYIARQRVAIANEVAARRVAEERVQKAEAEREKVRADARTREAQVAQQSAASAQQQAAQAQSQAQVARAQADSEAERARRLAAELQQLEAKQTARGMVVTFGDVLFDTGRAELRSGAMRSIERLATVLREHPERRVLIEGFTDSVGSDSLNMELSERRANAVRGALIAHGAPTDKIETRAYGKAHPVAGNDTAAGRQANRRVEIVFSDASGRIVTR